MKGPVISKDPSLFKVVLVEPEIPQNTGNIGRTCVGLQSELHIVGPTGFEISDRNLKRAGLDYWQHLQWRQYESHKQWQEGLGDQSRVFYFTTKADKTIYDFEFQQGDTFVFGKETKGLDASIIEAHKEHCARLPMIGQIRSLNLATAVAVVLFEAYRQHLEKARGV